MKRPSRPETSQRERFDQLIRPYVLPMYQTAYRLTGDRDQAEDLVQDVLTKLYPMTNKLSDVLELKPWLARTIHNRYVDAVRKRARSPSTVSNDFAYLSAVDANPAPDDQVANDDLSSALHQALDTLSPESRSLVVLHLMEGHTLERLTDVFDVPLGTLKSRLHTARSRLKKMLTLDEPFSPNKRVNEHELPESQKPDQSLQSSGH
jgi:RNA polymerase sigma factor (sigma-70 family)